MSVLPSSHVAVVDDSPTSRQALENLLVDQGFDVRAYPGGRPALDDMRSHPPDLVLLDVWMPGMDGYMVCERLKSDPATRDVPVIFISAAHNIEEKIKAFKHGGVDYVTKPCQPGEVLARIQTHLEIQRLKREAEARNRELQQSLCRLREVEAQREALLGMIIHDLRTPLCAISGYIDLLDETIKAQGKPADVECLTGAARCVNRLMEMISTMLDVSRLEGGKMPVEQQDHRLSLLIRTALDSVGPMLKGHVITVDLEHAEMGAWVDGELTRRVLVNILGNALKFTPPGGAISVTARRDGDRTCVTITDTGIGIPPEQRDQVFEKYGQVLGRKRPPRHSTGLGLTFCKLAVEAMGGTIGVTAGPSGGCSFHFSLPGTAPAPALSAA